MSGSVRARRPASPQPGLPHSIPTPVSHKYPPNSRQNYLDADARREAASKGYAPGRKNYAFGGINLVPGEWKLLVVIIVVASCVRFYRISQPNSVVFDEVHFGKFAAKYIKTRYFVDVHPPLAKMLIALAAFLFGFDGEFDFGEIGKVFERVPYVAMRMVPATLGVATIPISYLTLRGLDCRATTALLASIFLTFENGLVTQSRHILLDSPLVFFTALTILCWVGFANENKEEPFTEDWWIWLVLTGLSLGAVSSCKWVGLFTIATVGVCTISQLWLLLGDLRVSARLWMKHFMARALCLIVIPILFYMTMFAIHLLLLGSSGDGDGFMSSEFQQTLGGRHMEDTFADVMAGSEITIRHFNTQGGYLHSHLHNYPTGSQQQQVTLYPHRDENNVWRILNATVGDPFRDDEETPPLQYIENNMRVKIRHISTDKALHSHDHRPPVSDVDFQNEVSGYGMPGYPGDANDDWIVEIESGDSGDRESSKRLRTLRTHFKLRHMVTGCYLFSHKVKLPDWAFEQQEVTCNKNAVKANSLWYIETATHPNMPSDAPRVNYRIPGFLSKFFELQQVMWTTNAGLTDRHQYDSRPDSWPRLRRGINFWVKDHRQIYLIGNPFIWWMSSSAVTVYMIVRGLLILRAKRGFRDFDNTKVTKYDSLCGFLFIGWFLHYFPFFLMGRQLFLHHYFPALYFAILLSCGVFDLLSSTLRPRIRLQIAAVLVIIAVWNFSHFSALTYGTPWTKDRCNSAKWVKTWDFACHEFLDDYSHYSNGVTPSPNKTISAATGDGQPVEAIFAQDQQVQDGELPLQKDDSSTTIPVGQAEPGRNIFAGKDRSGIKSEELIFAHVEEAEEDKEVSIVVVEYTTSALEIEPEATQKMTVDDVVATEVPVVQTTEVETEQAGTEDLKEPDVAPVPAGPLDREDAIADQIAHELYPDARDKH